MDKFMYNIISFDIWRITSYLASLPNFKNNKKIYLMLKRIQKITKKRLGRLYL